ncbi:MAG: carboxymuconolactone decarboxylase family protein [Acidimicrobiales bacterium]
MPRLSQVPRSDDNAPIVTIMYDLLFGPGRDPVADPGTSTGTPGDWWTVFALVPDVLQHCVDGFGLYQSPKRHLDPKLRELGQTRAGWTRGSQFVFSQHCKSCRALGMPEAQIEAIPHWQVADCFDERERAVLAYTDALVYDGGRGRRRLRGAAHPPQRGGDPRADVHHVALRDARHDVPGAAGGVRRP